MKRIGEKITAWKGPSDQRACIAQKPTHLTFRPSLLSRSGIPETADAVAYEPVQRLLAVATQEGAVKVFGKYGVESLMKNTRAEGTKILFFPPNSGSLLRVTRSGVIELLDLELQDAIAVIELNDDVVESLALIPGQPYIVLGCASGLLRVCCIADNNLDPISQARPVMNLRLLNYRVSKHSFGASGKMTYLSVCLSTSGPLALMVHAYSGALVWNIRFSRPVCAVPSQSLDVLVSAKIMDPGEVTCASWIGKLTSPYMFATGHESGDVLSWNMPETLCGVVDRKALVTPQLVHRLHARPDNSLAGRVISLSFISGEEDGLLVFGGQSLEEPAGLNLFHLESSQELSEHETRSGKRTHLAWFGNILDFVLVPPNGSMEHFDDPSGIIILTEFGNLVLHDLKIGQPIPFSMPFQMCHKLCSTYLFVELNTSSSLIQFLMTAGDQSKAIMAEIGGACDDDYRWILTGGATLPSTTKSDKHPLLVLGYEDGIVRFWSIRNGIPICVTATRHSDIIPIASITVIELLDQGELLVTGDDKGHVIIFELSDTTMMSNIRKFTDATTRIAQIEEVHQIEGYQIRVVLTLNASSIWKIAFHPESHYLAALDSSGGTCVINLITLEPLYITHADTRSPNAIVDICFSETLITRREDESTTEVFLFMTDESSGIVAFEPSSGAIVNDTDWLHPKNESKSVQLFSIDSNGVVPAVTQFKLDGRETLFWSGAGRTPNTDSDNHAQEPLSGNAHQEAVSATETPIEETEERGQESPGPVSTASHDANDNHIHHERLQSDDTEINALLAAAVAKIDEPETQSPAKSRIGLGLGRLKKKALDGSLIRMPSGSEMFVAFANVVAAVRAPMHKISSPGQIAWAMPFSSNSPETLPSLEIIGSAQIDDIVEMPLFKKEDETEGTLANLKLVEADGNGGVYLCSRNGELIHIDISGQTQQDVESEPRCTLYDWDLAHAAHSASQLTQADAIHANIAVVGEKPPPTPTIRRGMEFLAALGRKARDELDRAIRPSALPNASDTPSSDTYEPPQLDVLFCAHDHKPRPEIRSDKREQPSISLPTMVTSGSRNTVHVSDVTTPKSATQRTAEEVRAKYGRPRDTYRTNTGAGEVGAVMSENVSMLEERGERLKTLNDKTEDLVNEAQSFAEMARKLAHQKSRKWWQL